MFNKVFIFVVLVCSVQVSKADDISDLIKELAPKIKEAAVRVANVTVNGGLRVTDAFVGIQLTLNSYEETLLGERGKLLKVVYEAIIETKEAGKDISNCISDVIVVAKDLTGLQFEACRISDQLNELTLDLAALAKEEVSLLAAPLRCTVSSGGDLNKLKACVLGIIDEVNKKSDGVEAKIAPNINIALESANHCGSERAAELGQKINGATNTFNDCVSNA